MSQRHATQEGTFHVTTNTKGKISWLTFSGVPKIIMDNLVMTRNVQHAEIFAFCILPDHMHILVRPGKKGLSKFMQSFKRNAAKDVRYCLNGRAEKHIDTEYRSGDSGISAWTAANADSPLRLSNTICISWQKGFHDERIQDDRQRSHAWRYITENALHHGLTENIDDWPWTSVHWEKILDPME